MPFRRIEKVSKGHDSKAKTVAGVTVTLTSEEASDSNVIINLVSKLVENLLFQRNQIPVQFQEIRRILAEKNGAEKNPFDFNPAESIRERRLRIKRINRDIKFRRSAAKFVDDFDRIREGLNSELMEGAEEVNLMFGSSAVRPKEIFNIVLSTNPIENPAPLEKSEQRIRKLQIQMFRNIIFNEALFQHFDKKMKKGNIFFAVKQKPSLNPSSSLFQPRTNLELSWRKAKKFKFTFQSQSDDNFNEEEMSGLIEKMDLCDEISKEEEEEPEQEKNSWHLYPFPLRGLPKL